METKILWDDLESKFKINNEDPLQSFAHYLKYYLGKDRYSSTDLDLYTALAYTVRDQIMEKWHATQKKYHNQNVKRVYYLSMEFLLGRLFSNNIINMGVAKNYEKELIKMGINWRKLSFWEREPALGNGGLGRLAACFLDSMATLALPSMGYGLRYEYGIFRQDICEGYQVEEPDEWLQIENAWEMKRMRYTFPVYFGGHVESYNDVSGQTHYIWRPSETILGVPYDVPIVGYQNNIVNTLRLWSAKVSEEFNLQDFNEGNYINAVSKKVAGETLTKVLYPDDRTEMGRELRFRQQYFFVSCSVKDILRRFKLANDDLRDFPKKNILQLNDTHPTISIAELMRILVDEEKLPWDTAWDITKESFGYTNHTIMPEALEKWPIAFFEEHLPRHLQIVYEINQRFLEKISVMHPGDNDILRRMSLIEESETKRVRMAHMAIVGSNSVNGVSEIHTEIIKKEVMPDFYNNFPEKFNNKTNGITPRRWLLMANPNLADLITSKIGDNWITNLDELRSLEKYTKDKDFVNQFRQIKIQNKRKMASIIADELGIDIDAENTIFDVQIKRIHEYKRQLLNVLHIIHLYCQIRDHQVDITPRVFIFAGKAAPGYYMAKMIIKLILNVANVINNDKKINDKIKIVFLPNYKVTMAENIIPATDVSEQISTAGKEASGTGNMKFALNGALTIGTMDGANIEIMEEVGKENIFMFGLNIDEIKHCRQNSYNPYHFYETQPKLKRAIDLIRSNYFSFNELGIFEPLCHSILAEDTYFLLADFEAYLKCQEEVEKAYQNQKTWQQKSILNVARVGKFSSDRTIREYAQDIWKIDPIK